MEASCFRGARATVATEAAIMSVVARTRLLPGELPGVAVQAGSTVVPPRSTHVGSPDGMGRRSGPAQRPSQQMEN